MLWYPWVGVGGSHVGEERLRGLQLDLEKMREKLGQKNYEYANLKVSFEQFWQIKKNMNNINEKQTTKKNIPFLWIKNRTF